MMKTLSSTLRLLEQCALVLTLILSSVCSYSSMTADHQKFAALQQSFDSVEAINEVCTDCHNQAESQLHDTIHWQWTFSADQSSDTGEANLLGKLHVINGYHPNVATNAGACGSCHIGYGLSRKTGFSIPDNSVDCLMCHDTSGEYFYRKFHQDGAECTMCHDDGGEANKKRVKKQGEQFGLSLSEIAQAVGATSAASCGSCHFYDGGADGAKHGDLDSMLLNATFEMDVHLSPEGANLTCSSCHQATDHQLAGSRYAAVSPGDSDGINALQGSRGSCVSCHGNRPMQDEKLNDHADVIACQTCHIPSYARNGIAVKTFWDWSTADKLDRKKRPIIRYDDQGRVIYASGKGDMTYGENLTPVYQWYDGQLDYSRLGKAVNPDEVTPLNPSHASRSEYAKIFPFHIFQSTLPYDLKSQQLLPVNFTGSSRNAFWNGYKWETALKSGARGADIDFSGEFGFTSVETIRALNHTVAPKEQALQCVDCHSKQGLLADVPGIYVVGSMQHPWLTRAGMLMLLVTLLGVLGHGGLRWFFAQRRNKV